MELEEFREIFINEDINAEAVNTNRYPVEVFIDHAVDILKNDYSLVSEMSHCFYQVKTGTRAYKSMHIDAAYLDLPGNTLNLLLADFNEGDMKSITNKAIEDGSKSLLNYFENCIRGFFAKAEPADPAVQLAHDIRLNLESLYTVHLFIVSTDRLSKAVKTLTLEDFKYKTYQFKVALDVLDIEKIYRSKMVNFEKEDLQIKCQDFGIAGIPCIKADIDTDQYESYLAIVPGPFLADIYKKYSSELLESNVRAFLKFNGGVNKGIRGTILNEKSRFFTYNNGISTTATEVETEATAEGLMITAFTNLQIINGGQTTATLAATSIKNHADLSGIFVQMKLTVLKNNDPELIRNIARYANSQNKVKTADLNSSHPFYVRMEELSRKLYAPLESGQLVQQLWFFERVRGQYEQPLMQMTKKAQRDDYKLVRPKSKKFTLTDMSKYMNAADMLPHYVSWGGEVNASHFHNNMLKQWEKNDSVFNELFYKELIGKKILFKYIEETISDQTWYQEKRAYRPQLVAYTFSKLVWEVTQAKKCINYRGIWDLQKVPDQFYRDVAGIGKLVFDCIYDENRPTANIETYCKKVECWHTVQKHAYTLSDGIREVLITPADIEIEATQAQKDQKEISGLSDEISIFLKGSSYWESLIQRGLNQSVINHYDEQQLKNAVNYCNGIYAQLTKIQLKEIAKVIAKLAANGIS